MCLNVSASFLPGEFNIKQQWDLWHGAKSFKKKLVAVRKKIDK